MSCIITYNGQNFTQEDFLDYLKSLLPNQSINSLETPKVEIYKGFWTREEVAKQTDKVFLFGDNFEDAESGYVPSSTQAVIRGLPNAIGISTKNNRGTNEGIMDRDDYQESSYLDNQDFEIFKKHVDNQIHKALESGKTIVLPEDGIGTGKAQLKERAPKLFEFLQQELDKLKQENKYVVEFNQPTDQIEARDHFNFQDSETLLQSVVSHPDVPQYLKDLAKQLLDKVNVKDINIETYAGNSKSVGLYNNTTNTVTINLRQFIENKTSTVERISETIVHEYIHAATVKGLKEFKAGTNDNVYLKNINTLFEQYRKDLIKEDGYQEFLKYLEKVKTKQDLTVAERQKGRELQNKYYAALEVEEFVTMGLSNPTTREILKSKNLLQKLFDSIASFLGLDNNMFTLLEKEYNKYLDSVNNNKQTFQEDNISNLDTYQYYGKTYQIPSSSTPNNTFKLVGQLPVPHTNKDVLTYNIKGEHNFIMKNKAGEVYRGISDKENKVQFYKFNGEVWSPVELEENKAAREELSKRLGISMDGSKLPSNYNFKENYDLTSNPEFLKEAYEVSIANKGKSEAFEKGDFTSHINLVDWGKIVGIEYKGKDYDSEAFKKYSNEIYEAVQKLKENGFKVGSATNNPAEFTNKVNSSFDKYGYVDVLTSGKNNFDFKSAVIKYILKDLGLEFKSDKELNNYLIKEKNEGRTFNLMQYVTLEELPDNKTRVKLNKRNLLLDSTEDFGPRSLGGLNFTSSGRDFESKNIFKNNIEQAFNCK